MNLSFKGFGEPLSTGGDETEIELRNRAARELEHKKALRIFQLVEECLASSYAKNTLGVAESDIGVLRSSIAKEVELLVHGGMELNATTVDYAAANVVHERNKAGGK